MDAEEHLARQYLEVGKDVTFEDATEPMTIPMDERQTDEAFQRPGYFGWLKANDPEGFCPDGDHYLVHLEPYSDEPTSQP